MKDYSELDAFTRKHYYTMSAATIGKLFNTSRNTVMRRATALGMKSKKEAGKTLCAPDYSEKEIAFVKNSAGVSTIAEVAKVLGRTKDSVKNKVKRLGLNYDFENYYSEDEDAYIIAQFYTKTYAEIGVHLGRTGDGVRTRAMKLGVTGDKPRVGYKKSPPRGH